VILHLDTSALAKLYVEERGTDVASSAVEKAARVATSRVTYAEGRAAFAGARRECIVTASMLREVVERLDADWARYDVVEVTEPLVRRAGALAEKRALRGFDSIQLASALEALRGVRGAFLCWDERLARAATAERLRLVA
jgi:predicted nucleic acid-binding protein